MNAAQRRDTAELLPSWGERMPNGSTSPAKTEQGPPPSLSAVLGAGLGFILIAGPVLALIFVLGQKDQTSSIAFGALEVLVVLSATLAGLIIVTQALGLSTPGAALGLPKGSVRALLAFSLVVIFVAVASWNLGGFLDRQSTAVNVKSVLVENEDDALAAFRNRGIDAFVGRRTGTEATVYFVEGPDEDARRRSTDMAKDILTVVATVLVTVVGFYFGSSSTVDGVRSARNTMESVKKALFDGNGAAGAERVTPFTFEDVGRTRDATRAIANNMKNNFDKLSGKTGEDPTKLLTEAVDKNPALKPRLEKAKADYVIMKDAVRAAKVYADKAEELAKDKNADTGQAVLNDAGAQVTQLQDDAKKSKDQFDAAMKTFVAASNEILSTTAEE